MNVISPEIPEEVSRQAAADLLGITPQRVDQLVKKGVLPKIDRGRYSPVAVVAAYVSWRAGETERRDRSAAADAVREARAEEIRLRIARQQRQLIPLEDAEEALDYIIGRYIAFLDALPARLTRDPGSRDEVRAIIDEGREQLSNDMAKATAAARNGGSPHDVSTG